MLGGAELIHLGGGESLPCPGIDSLPLSPEVRNMGLGTSRLALPPARLHVIPDAVVMPSSGVVCTRDGRVVAESVTSPMIGRVPLDGKELRTPPLNLDGTVAVFRSPLRSDYHTLVDDLPRAGLVAHPALGRLGPITLLHGGALSDLEATLLGNLGGHRVRLREVEPGQPVRAARVVIPNFVTRPGAGAVPSWYRRWSDRVPLPEASDAPRRVYVSAATDADVPDREELQQVLDLHGIVDLDRVGGSVAERLAVLRDAEMIVGRGRDALAVALISRSAHVVELFDPPTLDPSMYYLAVSKGLPYHYVPVADDARTALEVPSEGSDALDRVLDRLVA